MLKFVEKDEKSTKKVKEQQHIQLNFFETMMEGLIHHSDRASQYGSKADLQLQRQHRLETSMGAAALANTYTQRITSIIKNKYCSIGLFDPKTSPSAAPERL